MANGGANSIVQTGPAGSDGAPPYANPPWWRVVLAFAIAPLAATLLFSLFVGGGLFLLAVVFGAYPPAIVLGVPLYLLLRNRVRPHLWAVMLAGFVIAALPWFFLSLGSNSSHAEVGQCIAVVNGNTTWCGWLSTVILLGEIGAFGAFGGAVFWVCAVWRPR